jgi:hypothetical protein
VLLQKRANLLNHLDGPLAQCGVDLNLMSTALVMGVDGAPWDIDLQHLLQAQCLGAKLEIRVVSPAPADLVLYGVRPIRSKLDKVGFAAYPEAMAPERHIPLEPNVALHRVDARVHPFVGKRATHRVEVFVIGPIEMYQRTLPRAVTVVLDGRDQDLKLLVCLHYSLRWVHTSHQESRQGYSIWQLLVIDDHVVVREATWRADVVVQACTDPIK